MSNKWTSCLHMTDSEWIIRWTVFNRNKIYRLKLHRTIIINNSTVLHELYCPIGSYGKGFNCTVESRRWVVNFIARLQSITYTTRHRGHLWNGLKNYATDNLRSDSRQRRQLTMARVNVLRIIKIKNKYNCISP